MVKLKVLIVNGATEAGKGTATRFIKECLKFDIVYYSSIDYVKEVAESKFMWDGQKDVKGRNLLSSIKQLMISYGDIPTKKIIAKIEMCILLRSDLIIVDIREPSEIDKLVNYCKENDLVCHTCRIKNNKAEQNTKNSGLSITGDLLYGRYPYDIYIYNNGTVKELEEQVKKVFTNLYVHNKLEKQSELYPGSHKLEPPIVSKGYCEICNHGELKKEIRTMMKVCNYCGQRYIKR